MLHLILVSLGVMFLLSLILLPFRIWLSPWKSKDSLTSND